MLQLPNSPIFEGQEQKNTSNSPSPRRIRTFATIFFDGSSNKQIGGSLLGCFVSPAGKIILVPRLGWLMAEMICEKKNRATFEATNVRTVPRE